MKTKLVGRSMFRNVVASLNEALDITMHLKPLTEHFEVIIIIAGLDSP